MKNSLPPGEALSKVCKPVAQEAKDTADWLWSQVKERYPFLKQPDLYIWSQEIEKIHRLDGKDWQMIKMVTYWSQNDPFWRQQIRSGANLRKHFETMMIKVYEQQKTKPQVFKI
jgi:hypothetical protein